MNPIYCAYAAKDGTYKVGTLGYEKSITPIGDIKSFADFNEANQVAKDMAAGKYPDIKPRGYYVNMR